jgi:hypothetical protein
LVVGLLASLEPVLENAARTDDAWIEEVERRARAAIAGSPDVPWSEARAHLKDRLTAK